VNLALLGEQLKVLFSLRTLAVEKQSPRAAKPQAIPGERNAKLVEKRNALLIFKKRNA